MSRETDDQTSSLLIGKKRTLSTLLCFAEEQIHEKVVNNAEDGIFCFAPTADIVECCTILDQIPHQIENETWNALKMTESNWNQLYRQV